MESLYEELMKIVNVLESENIEYALCGGLALAIHAEPRFTKDIDLLVRKEDLDNIKQCLTGIGFDCKSGVRKCLGRERSV